MSVDYATGLSEYHDLGVCGVDEVFDKFEIVEKKVDQLVDLLVQFKGSCVVHVGAGLSTSAGIPDFRGKKGVWTRLQQAHAITKQADCDYSGGSAKIKDEKHSEIDVNDSKQLVKPFDETVPTIGHLVLKELCERGYIRHIVSQNVDGLFLKSNLARGFISELHGNFYLDECTRCRSRFIRATSSKTMRLQRSRNKCLRVDRSCGGYLRDTILDWESAVPFNELRTAEREAKRAALHLAIGTSLQLKPSKDLVCCPRRNKSKRLVVINLQPIHLDPEASLVINYYSDEVLKLVAQKLDIDLPSYDHSHDPTKCPDTIGCMWKK